MKMWAWITLLCSFGAFAEHPVYEYLEVNGAKQYFAQNDGVMTHVTMVAKPELKPFAEVVRAWEQKYFAWPVVRESLAPVYTQRFSTAELEVLTKYIRSGRDEEFYDEVVWNKYQRELEGINRDLIAAGHAHSKKVEVHLYEMLNEHKKNSNNAAH